MLLNTVLEELRKVSVIRALLKYSFFILPSNPEPTATRQAASGRVLPERLT